MGQTTEFLTSAIDRWHLDAATGAKDSSALRRTMLALAAHIDHSHSELSGAQRIRLQGKLESVAHAVAPIAAERTDPKQPASDASASTAGEQHVHVSIFA